jgi:putative ABC transport system substrate-binding protein
VAPKRLELLHELVPTARSIALLVNTANPVAAGAETKQLQAVLNALGLHLQVVIGFLGPETPDLLASRLRAFRRGLNETGFVEGRSVTIEYRWAEGHNDRLPALAADLVRHQVSVIATSGTPAAMAAKQASTTIATVFAVAIDPVAVGLVASLPRPGGNVTGTTSLGWELGSKGVELLHELLPTTNPIALLVNPTNPAVAEAETKNLLTAASSLGVQLRVLHASNERDFETVLAALAQGQAGALIIGNDLFFNSRLAQLAALTVHHALPAIHQYREFAEMGGLMSYGASVADAYRLAGVYAGRILKGDKPSDLPVVQSTKVELVINMKTAKTLGLTFPLPLLGRADEVIE